MGPGGSLGSLAPERGIPAARGLKHLRFPQGGWAPAGTQIPPAAMLEMASWVTSALNLPMVMHLSEQIPSPCNDSMACSLMEQDPSHLEAYPGPILTPSRTQVRAFVRHSLFPGGHRGGSHPLQIFVPLPSQRGRPGLLCLG